MATLINLNDTTPVAPSNGQNVKWQSDASSPTNVSAYLDLSNLSVPKLTFIGATSGSAIIGVAALAGTPNRINLPTTTGAAGQALVTDGGNPQQLFWSTSAVDLPFGVDTGVANAYIVNPIPAVTATLGQTFNWTTTNPNTTTCTINVSGTGVKNLFNPSGAALTTGAILSGVRYSAVYDGQEWVLGGFDSIPGAAISLPGVITLVSLDPASGFNGINGAPLILIAKNPPATRQPLLVFSNAAGTSSTFIGFDNDNVCVFGANDTRYAFLSGTNVEFFDEVDIVNNTSFGGHDLFIQPSLGGLNKSSGGMLQILSGDGASQVLFDYLNVFSLSTITAATNVANHNSLVFSQNGTYWTGSVSATDSWTFQNIIGTGSNPTSTLTISHSGTSGVASFIFPTGVGVVQSLSNAPSTSSSTGVAGQIAWDASGYVYICTATNTWVRNPVAFTTF